jgi:hypothetical protein
MPAANGGPRPQRRSKVPLDHRVHRLALPALSVQRHVTLCGEPPVHPSSQRLVPRWRLFGGTSRVWRDDRPHIHVQPGQSMILLRVIAGIRHHAVKALMATTPGVKKQIVEERLITSSAGRGNGREDQMRTAVAGKRELGQALYDPAAPAIDRFAPFSRPFFAAASFESRRRRS